MRFQVDSEYAPRVYIISDNGREVARCGSQALAVKLVASTNSFVNKIARLKKGDHNG